MLQVKLLLFDVGNKSAQAAPKQTNLTEAPTTCLFGFALSGPYSRKSK